MVVYLNMGLTPNLNEIGILFEFKFCEMESPFIEKAIPMVSVDDKTGKYVLTTQALNFFRAINGPIAVVSVAGLYRTGKSYLLNRVLLNRSNGFGVGPTVNPCTKGLWCWGTPIKGTSTDGQAVNIVVIDTQGIGALDQDQTHDTKIFTLAILASSCFIYNSVGSIDQTAIQNLSLVVNLTKHIQLKSEDQNDEGVDPDEISMYFPTFYWVVRDFSLQLQDPEGNQISSKQYLEKALAPQNGFSDDIEQKNRIRRLLTAFFKDRDCFTMIRPLVDQMKLQNLDKMDYDQLRPQFVQQAMNFRKRIISSIKAKTLQNQKLNGTLYCSMMNSYVTAINEGAVPNIENAWNYMCEEQCRRAMDECYQIFIRSLQDNLRDLPKPEEDFNRCVVEAEERALQTYREKALGAQATPGYNELKNRIRTQIAEIREENIKQSYKNLREYIVKNATLITKKLNSQQYNSYSEYEKEVTAMGEKFLKDGPKLHNYKYVYLQAVRKLSAQGAEFLFKNFSKQQQKTSEMFRQKEKQMSGEITTLKSQCELLRKKYNESMSEADQKIFELSSKEETLRKQLQITMKLKEEEEKKMQRDLESKMSEQRSKYRALEDKFNELSLHMQDATRQSTTEQQTWLKEKAVLEQQVKYNLIQIEQLQKREKTLDATLNLKQNSMSKEVRQISMRLQTEKESLKQRLSDQSEKINEMSEEITALKQELQEKNDKFEKKEKKYKQDLAAAKRDMEKMRKDVEHERRQIRDQLQSHQENSKEELNSIEAKLKDTERALKDMTDKMRITKSELQTQNSLVSQQNMFIKQENNALRSKVEQLKQSYETAFKSYQQSINESSKENMDKRIVQMQKEHKHEKQNMTQTFQSEKNRIMCEYNNIKSQYEQLEMKFSSMKKQKESKQMEMKTIQEELKVQINILINQKNNLENNYKESLSEKEGYYENQLRRVQQEYQEYKDNSIEEYGKMTNDTHMKLEQLRNQSEIEVQNMQRKLHSQREKCERKIRELTEEHQKILEEQRQNFDNMQQELGDRLANTEQLLRNTTSQYQHNNDMLNKQNVTLMEINRELKQTIEKKEQQFSMKEMTLTEQYRGEKEKYQAKIEIYVTTNNQKEREIMNLQHQKDQITSVLERKESKLNEVELELTKTQEKLKVQIEKMMVKHKELETQMLQRNSGLSRENALLQQKISFQVSRVQQLEQTLSNINKSNEQKYNMLKNEKEEELKNITVKLTNERTQIDSKYQQLKATYKDMEMNLKKSLNQTFTSKTLLEERIANAQIRLRENEASRVEEVTSLRAELMKTRENTNVKDKENQETIKSLNHKIEKVQNEKTEVTMALEKERVLAEQSRLMHQKILQDYKKETDERIQKLQAQLARQYNNRLHDKNAVDSNHNQTLLDLQNRHSQKVQDLNDALSKAKFQYESNLKDRDNQIKELNEKYENEKNFKNMSNSNYERRITELQATEKKLNDQLEKLRKQKNTRETEIIRREQTEKENLRKKLVEYENKVKEGTNKLMSTHLEFERDRSRLIYEKQNISEKLTESKEAYDKLKKEYEKMKNESDKMKAQRKNTKEKSYIGNLKTYHEPMKTQKTVIIQTNKENANFQ